MRLTQTFTGIAFTFIGVLPSITWGASPSPTTAQAPRKNVAEYVRNSLLFEENHGQAPTDVNFVSRAPGYRVFIAPAKVDLYLSTGKDHPAKQISIGFDSANLGAQGTATDRTAAQSAYMIGGKSKWIQNLVNYQKVHYNNIWPGVGITYYGTGSNLEYDFELQPGADSNQVRFQFSGIDSLRLDSEGNLILKTAGSELIQPKPRMYQQLGGRSVEIAGGYRILADRRVGFEIAAYDHTKQLVIDPILSFTVSSLGFGVATANAVATDAAANTYLTGETFLIGQPAQNNAYYLKLDPNGNTLAFIEFGGGDGPTIGNAIAVDSNANAYIGGQTATTQLINCSTCGFQPTLANAAGTYDGFLVVFTPAGTTVKYITYLGGSGNDAVNGVAADTSGAAYVVGTTLSSNFPVTEGSTYRASNGTAFAMKINTNVTTGSGSRVWSTFVGGTGMDSGTSVALDASLNVLVAGATTSSSASFLPSSASGFSTTKSSANFDGFVVKLNSSGNTPAWSTFFPFGPISGIATFSSRAYVTGQTNGSISTTASGAQLSGGANHAFFTDFETTASGAPSLIYSTYLGGSGQEAGTGVAAAPNGRAYISGWTTSANFPITGAPTVQSSFNGSREGFLSFIDPTQAGTPSLAYSMYIGATNTVATGVAADTYNDASVSASTFSNAVTPASTGGLAVRIGGQIWDPTFFVSEQYVDLLDRAAESAGLTYWVNLLTSRQLTRDQVASSFFNSPEFSQVGLNIIKYYIAVLGRDPDFSGWLFYFNQVNVQHISLDSILNTFINGPEFQNTYGNLSGNGYVNLVYQNVLGRAPDQAGHDYWLGLLNAGSITRAQMMASFISGAEFNNSVRPRAFANLLYMGFLRRSADPAGLIFWTGRLQDPNQLPTVISAFITSPEYVAKF